METDAGFNFEFEVAGLKLKGCQRMGDESAPFNLEFGDPPGWGMDLNSAGEVAKGIEIMRRRLEAEPLREGVVLHREHPPNSGYVLISLAIVAGPKPAVLALCNRRVTLDLSEARVLFRMLDMGFGDYVDSVRRRSPGEGTGRRLAGEGRGPQQARIGRNWRGPLAWNGLAPWEQVDPVARHAYVEKLSAWSERWR
jgi:hypothetical protein